MPSAEADMDALGSAWGAADESFSDAPVGSATAPCPLAKAPPVTSSFLGLGKSDGEKYCPNCQGVGMLNKKNAKEVANEFKQLRSQWTSMTKEQRKQKVEDLINDRLKKQGVPRVNLTTEDTGGAGNASFNRATWQIAVNKATIESDKPPSDAEMQALAGGTFHESRHAEQFFLVARRRAAEDPDFEIVNATQIKPQVVAQAQKAPLDPNSKEAKCARQLESDFIGNAAHHAKTERAVVQGGNAVRAASAALKALKAKNAPAPEVKAAEARLQDALKAHEPVYKDYRALPVEADAWEASNLVNDAW